MFQFQTVTGKVIINYSICKNCGNKPCINACKYNILKVKDGKPALNMDEESVKKGRCIECLACELECMFEGQGGLKIELPIPEWDYVK